MHARTLDGATTAAETLLSEAYDPLLISPPFRLAQKVARSVRIRDVRARLLLTPDGAEELFDEFCAATAAAKAIADGHLAVRTDPGLDESLTVDEGLVWVNVTTDAQVRSLPTCDAVTAETFRDAYEPQWEDADEYSPEVPGRDIVLDSFRDRWPEAVETLSGALEGADSVCGDDPIDAVAVCTLVGARHELFSIDLGEWVRKAGFSSRTEVARAKKRLAETDIVKTKRVVGGVGRPRQQLALADDELAAVAPEALVAAARDRFAVSESHE